MKRHEFYIGFISVALSLLPLILLTNVSIIDKHFNEITKTLEGLMFLSIVVAWWTSEGRCLSIYKYLPNKKIQKDFFTVPIMVVIFLCELIIFYFIKPDYVEKNFNSFISLFGGVVFTFIMYIVFGGNYRITKINEKKVK